MVMQNDTITVSQQGFIPVLLQSG